MERGSFYIKYRRIAIALVLFNVIVFTTFGILFWRHLRTIERMGSLDPVQVQTHIASLGTKSVLTPDAPSLGIGTMLEGSYRTYTNDDLGLSFLYPSEWGEITDVVDQPDLVFHFSQTSLRLTSKSLEPQTTIRDCVDMQENGFFGRHLLPDSCETFRAGNVQIPVVTVGLFAQDQWNRIKIAQIPTKKGLYFFIVEDQLRFDRFNALIQSITLSE